MTEEIHDRETVVVQQAVTRDTVMWRMPFDRVRVYEDEIPALRADYVLCGSVYLARDERGIYTRIDPARVMPVL